jgi:hypothetical protein
MLQSDRALSQACTRCGYSGQQGRQPIIIAPLVMHDKKDNRQHSRYKVATMPA